MLQDYPSDILIDILTRLDLQDVITFLSTCSFHRKLRDSRYLWISLLKQTAKHRNLACPVGTDVSQLDTNDLQRIAILTNRIEQNWSQDNPKVKRAVKSVPCMTESSQLPGGGFAILAVIPATSFIILYAENSEIQNVVLCDTDGAMPTSSIHIGTICRHAHFDEPGRHLVGLVVSAVGRPEMSLQVLSIEYGAAKIPSIRQVFHLGIDVGCRALFLCQNVAGMVFFALDDSPPSIQLVNFERNITTHISGAGIPNLLDNTGSIMCSIVNGEPGIISVMEGTYDLYRLPVDKLGPRWEDGAFVDDNLIIPVASIRAAIVDAEEYYDTEMAAVQWSAKGLSTLFNVYNDGEGCTPSRANTHVSFWPINRTYSPPEPPIVATLTFEGKIGSYHGLSPWLFASTRSGNYKAVIIVDDFAGFSDTRPHAALHLLQFDDDPPLVHDRQLELPFYIDLHEIYAIAIDERRGAVYLSHALGHIFAVPYA